MVKNLDSESKNVREAHQNFFMDYFFGGTLTFIGLNYRDASPIILYFVVLGSSISKSDIYIT